ncbi:MAG: diguanylate cyclase, partial [Pseudomonadota bacterium]|nr:diguanylate cyclase [Pseudomonadota bacterium]
MFAPRSLQTRIVALFLVLLLAVQIGGFVLINTVGVAAARKSIGEDLAAGAQLFNRLLEQDRLRLVQGARLLSSDYALREAIASNDRATISSVLVNHGKRIDAALMMLVGLDQRVMADTLDADVHEPFPFPKLLGEAERRQQAAAIVVVRGQLYQLGIVPVLAPLPVAWVAVGFPVDDVLATEMRKFMRLDVSFMSRLDAGRWKVHGTTLDSTAKAQLVSDLTAHRYDGSDEPGNAATHEADILTRVITLPTHTDHTVVAVLQQHVTSALEPFRRLQLQLAAVSLMAVVVSILASLLMARGIARPVRELAAAAQRIASGDYTASPPASRTQEIGELAAAFRTMQERIASRESRIMDLAYRDTLTALPNRALYIERLEEALQEASRVKAPVAVLIMDLDHFKYVNDTLGHSIGDLLLSEVARRVVGVVKGPASIVARLGGDEFAILLPGQGAVEALALAHTVGQALEAPMSLHGHVVDVRASLGIAVYPDHGLERSTLLRHADVAMYAAKRNNSGTMV